MAGISTMSGWEFCGEGRVNLVAVLFVLYDKEIGVVTLFLFFIEI